MVKNIQVVDVTHRKNEYTGYRTRREKGQDSILFVHFLSPASVIIDDNAIDLARNACIIYTPGIKQDYGAITESSNYENNFVTFKTDTLAFFAQYKVPLNEPFYINNEAEITACVEWITWASANRTLSLDEEKTEHVHELFTLLEKGMVGLGTKNMRVNQTRQRFIALRGEIMLNPMGWSVGKMAAACWLTRSRFFVLYKSFFNISPSDDLLMAVLTHVKERLVTTTDSIAMISAECGYARVESFIRMFSDNEGITPGQYRKKNKPQRGV